jgi:transcriptional regulator with XRE-family HTH domain
MLDMQLKEWRKKRDLSQSDLAEKLEAFARAKDPENPKPKRLRQTTVGSWERGTLPRKYWLNAIKEFTKEQVLATDFVMQEKVANGA